MKFRETFAKIVRALLNRLGLVLLNEQLYNTEKRYFRDVLIESLKGNREEKIDSIVFSKDRAMQLHAFLSSYLNMVDEYGKIYILYKASNHRHAKSYRELIDLFDNDYFIFIKEENFRWQLLDICESSNAKTIGFYVDDMIFTRKVDYRSIISINTLDYVPTLGRGNDLDYSQVLNKKLVVPDFISFDSQFFKFRWDYSEEYSDWTYPLGVSAYFYGRDEVLVMFKNIDFKSPNSLEGNMQKFKTMFIKRFGLCLSKIACVCVHANLVQTEFDNPTINTFSVEDLLLRWEAGLKIDLKPFVGKSLEAQFFTYQFLDRTHAGLERIS